MKSWPSASGWRAVTRARAPSHAGPAPIRRVSCIIAGGPGVLGGETRHRREPMEPSFQPELLVQHGRFVRTLALRLLSDPQAADDVAQDTWLRFLKAGPSESSGLRPW